MILQALTEYYETLAAPGKISPRNYATANVSFALGLAGDGSVVSVTPLRQNVQAGRKTVERPQSLTVPEPVVRGVNVVANFLCDNCTYLLGIDAKGKPERARECFEATKSLHLGVLDGVPGEAAAAVRAFFEKWEPANAAEHPLIKPHLEEMLKGANITFLTLSDGYAFEDPDIRAAWERHRDATQGEVLGQCLVTGRENQPIARIHPKIKGVQGAQSVGASLVGFNAPAYESYGKEQSFNAPVSEYAAFAYATTLNHLLADREHRLTLGGDTVVCWAKDGEAAYQEAFLAFVNPRAKAEAEADENTDPRVRTEGEVFRALKTIAAGEPIDLEGLSATTPFYILCLSPNAARLSVRFFYRDSFGNILKNVAAHYERLDIEKGPKDMPYVSLYWLLKATVFEQSKDDASSPLLAGAVLRAIVSGAPYPEALYSNILMRIRAERGVDRVKAAFVKAHLIRNGVHYEDYKGVVTVALNEASANKPYVLGRLFALLEQTQENANPGINATITDKYFDSACATPRLAFPTLLRLSRHHISKDDQWGWRNDRLIAEVIERLEADDDPYPAHLTPEEQGIFILGYYHQRQARFRKKDKQETNDAAEPKENNDSDKEEN